LENRLDLEDARKALQDIKKVGSITWEKIKKQKKKD